MFRLIKLCIYAFLGYALYELYQGMMAEQGSAGSFGGQSRGGGQGSRSNMTGAGQGQRETTEEPGGTSASHNVGRGVVS